MRRILRLLIRCISLATMAALLTGVFVPWPWAPIIVPALSPYVLISSGLAGQAFDSGQLAGEPAWWSVSLATLVGLPVLLVTLFSRRCFCRYACPVGLITEPLRRLRRSARSSFAALPHVGRWIVVSTWAGAVLGFPLAMWLDPLAIFSGVFSLRGDPANAAGWASALALLLIATSAALWPNAWCLRICPLGATQDLLALGGRAVAKVRNVRQQSDSLSRGQRSWRPNRRSVLSLGVGTLAAAGGVGVAWSARSSGPNSRPKSLRPPGAAGEEQFPWLCVRCGNCVRACPERILHPDQSPASLVGYLAPVVEFGDSYCKEDCCRCTEVCPSGALARLSPEAKKRRPMGLAHVDMSACLLSPDNGERECAICRNACPYDAIQLEFDWDTYVTSPIVDPQACPGCGACEAACPATNEAEQSASAASDPPRKAIFIVPRNRQDI